MVGDIIYKRSSRMNIAAFGAFMNVKYDLIAKRVFQENKARQIFRKTNISYPPPPPPPPPPPHPGAKKCSFFGKFGVLCFLVTSVLRSALLSYYRRFHGLFPLFTRL